MENEQKMSRKYERQNSLADKPKQRRGNGMNVGLHTRLQDQMRMVTQTVSPQRRQDDVSRTPVAAMILDMPLNSPTGAAHDELLMASCQLQGAMSGIPKALGVTNTVLYLLV